MLCKGYEKLYEILLNLNTDIEDTNTEKIRKFARLGIVYVGNPNLIAYCPFCVAINPNNSKDILQMIDLIILIPINV